MLADSLVCAADVLPPADAAIMTMMANNQLDIIVFVITSAASILWKYLALKRIWTAAEMVTQGLGGINGYLMNEIFYYEAKFLEMIFFFYCGIEK